MFGYGSKVELKKKIYYQILNDGKWYSARQICSKLALKHITPQTIGCIMKCPAFVSKKDKKTQAFVYKRAGDE